MSFQIFLYCSFLPWPGPYHSITSISAAVWMASLYPEYYSQGVLSLPSYFSDRYLQWPSWFKESIIVSWFKHKTYFLQYRVIQHLHCTILPEIWFLYTFALSLILCFLSSCLSRSYPPVSPGSNQDPMWKAFVLTHLHSLRILSALWSVHYCLELGIIKCVVLFQCYGLISLYGTVSSSEMFTALMY